jgi:hypothetical protein
MRLKLKKILAKEILVFAVIIIVSSIIYFSFELYERNARKSNAEITIKIKNTNKEIKNRTDSIQNLRSPLNLTEALKILKPWEKFDKNRKPKFNQSKPYEIDDEYGIKKKINPKKDSLKSIVFKNQILKLAKENKTLESQLVKDLNLESSYKKIIIILLILAYPIRLLIFGIIWSIRIVKRKEN